jgi:polyvinyl alcohol dehydrogenase (cytochrome)
MGGRTVAALVGAVALVGIGASAAPTSQPAGAATARPYYVYWDQNEEIDSYNSATGSIGQVVPPYDPNGQLCLFPDGSGRFVTAYNPTTDPTNGGYLKPAMEPPVGEAVWDRYGNFTGQTLSVPGPYMLPGQTVGGDIPPDPGTDVFNDNGTFTGCAFDAHANLFAVDLGTAQGQFPSPDSGRLVEWFAPGYQTYCIVDGPTSGGDGPHHVDGTGGLSQPGDLAFDSHQNLLVPEVGSATNPFGGRVLSFAAASLPQSAADCGPEGTYPPGQLSVTTFIQGSAAQMPFPQAIAHDRSCNCWAVSSTIGDPAIAWFDRKGRPDPLKGTVPGEIVAKVGQDPNGYNPFGLTFAPDGSAYFVDIHIVCSAPLTNCGPGNNVGRVMHVTFTNGRPNTPTVIASGYNFPTSVSVCTPSKQTCPIPLGTTSQWDWSSYGHDLTHSFAGRTTLTRTTAAQLAPAWTFPTGDAVTATPTVVEGSVYAGSWDGSFYALDLATGAMRWKFQLDAQPAVTPYPGQTPRDSTSDGGLVTSSAWFQPGGVGQPDLVIFAGGYTLYALDARSGALVWKHAYTGLPEQPPDPASDYTRIFSSPVVANGDVLFGVDVDGNPGHRGYVVAADVATGNPIWEYQTDADTHGQVVNDGCGSVWSSGTVVAPLSEVVFDVADCNDSNVQLPTDESVIALDLTDGHLRWALHAPRTDPHCDLDFGATANAGIAADGTAAFLGVGGKDGTYYSLDPATGQVRWSTNVVFGGPAGGFIGTTAYDGRHVFGSTALGDVGNTTLCDPANPRDTALQEPTAHAFSASSGHVLWQGTQAASFGATTVANGMTFNCPALTPEVQVRNAGTGRIITQVATALPCWSGVATAGDAIVVGTGTTAQGSPAGIVAFTPGGRPPVVPAG